MSCVLLSAGESKRFGSPKALAMIDQFTSIDRIQRTLLSSKLDELIIVLGAHADLITPHVFKHNKVHVVYNKNYKLGQTSSFQAGASSVDKKSNGIMLLPIDYPLITTATIDALIQEFNQQKPSILIPTFLGRRAHPPLFNIHLKQEILALPTHQGINTIFTKHEPKTFEVNDLNVLKTFNTTEELEKIKQAE